MPCTDCIQPTLSATTVPTCVGPLTVLGYTSTGIPQCLSFANDPGAILGIVGNTITTISNNSTVNGQNYVLTNSGGPNATPFWQNINSLVTFPTTLMALTDVNSASISTNEFLQWNGTQFIGTPNTNEEYSYLNTTLWDYNSTTDVANFTTYTPSAGMLPSGGQIPTSVTLNVEITRTESTNTRIISGYYMEFRKNGTSTALGSPIHVRSAGLQIISGETAVLRQQVDVEVDTAGRFQYISPYLGGTANNASRRFKILKYNW